MDNELDSNNDISNSVIDALDSVLDFSEPFTPPSVSMTSPSEYNLSTTLVPVPSLPVNRRKLAKKPIEKPNKYIDALHNEFLESLGASHDLKNALSRSSLPRAKEFLAALCSPSNRGKSLTRLARRFDISPIDIADIFRSYYLGNAAISYFKGAEPIANDVLSDARSQTVECPRCGGFGEVQHPRTDKWVKCPRCKGASTTTIPGSNDARKLVAEVVGWTKSKSGSINVVNINNSPQSVESVIEELDRVDNVIDITPTK